MIDRTTLEKDINDVRKYIASLEKDIRQLRDWISTNERGISNMQESLRRITEEGILKARTDLAQRENDLQRTRAALAQNEKILGKLSDIERKKRDIASLEQDQERIIVLLEKNRSELSQLQQEYDELTRPKTSILPPCEIVLPNNQRISLNTQKSEYLIGWHDGSAAAPPDIDLQSLQGSTQGVSRHHAVLRLVNGEWTITDLKSTNGTFLNDIPLAPNTPTVLQDKTRIRLGKILVFFRHITQTTRL